MALLTTYTDTNKVVRGVEPVRFPYANLTSGGVSQHRDDLHLTYAYTGMDYDSAVSCQTALHDPDNGVHATVRQSHVAGIYEVEVVEVTLGTWTDDA